MKISIITLQNVTNYGSVLQTYATQSLFQQMGYQVEFIDYVRRNQTKQQIRKNREKPKNISGFVKDVYRTYIGSTIISAKKKKSFDGFVKKNINITHRRYYSIEELRKNPPQADVYCTGSDQMWNSGWNGGIERSYFLDFIEQKPKFAFSTSVGMDKFPENERLETALLLKRYNFITVREKSAEKLLASLGIRAKTILDPTLLLDGGFWRKFARKVKQDGGKYILVYQLNPSHGSIKFKEYVLNLSKKMNLPVKAISYGYKIRRDFDEYVCLPSIEEFVSLFMNAEYVVTDSFHGISFCVNLNRQFTVIYPLQYSSRLSNILQLCDLEDRVYSGIEENLHLKKIDYERVNSVMLQKRKNSLEIIKNYLSQMEKDINEKVY